MAYLVYPNDVQHHVEGTYAHRHMAYSQDHVTSTGSIYAYQTSGLPDTSGYSRTMAKQPSESLKAPAPLGQHYFVDHMMNPHPYSSIYPGIDINAIRRKNASRETTGPLKAWLRDHRKNPYPTKGEKVMLAIATRMTLTQVSTWFANARRRMKKDKNEDDEEDDRADLSNLEAHVRADRSDSISSRLSQSSSEADTSRDLSDTSDIDDNSFRARQSRKCVQRLFSPEIRHSHVPPSSSPDSLFQDTSSNHGSMLRLAEALDTSENIDVLNDDDEITKMPTEVTKIPLEKPKIWSISEIISSNRPAPSHVPTHYHNDHVEVTDSTLNMYMNPLSNFSQYLTNYSLPVHSQL